MTGRRKTVDLSPEDIERLGERWGAGEPSRKLAREVGCSQKTLLKALNQAGYRPHPRARAMNHRGGRKKIHRFQPEDLERWGERWESGEPCHQLAKEAGCSKTTLLRALRQAGYRPTSQARERHPYWKGGRPVTSQGYILVRVWDDWPYPEMVYSNGYVLEHRKVMAETLGRALRPWEGVRHVDGDRANNDPSNLQLRSSGRA